MRMLLILIGLIFLIVVVLCLWKTVEYFNTLPASNKGRQVLAWDALVLFCVGIGVIMKIAMI